MKKFRKYNWPENPEDIREYDDCVLKKLWQYAPLAKKVNDHASKCSSILADEMVSRGLK